MAFLLSALALALLAAPAQEIPPPPMEPAAEAAEAAPSQPAPSGLPRRAPEPRTMAEFWPVFAVLALSWVGITGYLLRLGGRAGRIARTLRE